jgi:REP element-mobilizing transposase RayT
MPNTYTQLYVQIIFAVKHRHNLIREDIRQPVEKYICGIITQEKSKPMAIYCNPDHVHILVSLHPSASLGHLVHQIKSRSTKLINHNKWLKTQFCWQRGYGAFTYRKVDLDGIARYIHNQPIHHRNKSFKEEYLELLTSREVDYDDGFLFEWYS